jgi:hypothetical protein
VHRRPGKHDTTARILSKPGLHLPDFFVIQNTGGSSRERRHPHNLNRTEANGRTSEMYLTE